MAGEPPGAIRFVVAFGCVAAACLATSSAARAAEPGLEAVREIEVLNEELRLPEAKKACSRALTAGGHSMEVSAALHYICAVVGASIEKGDAADRLCRLSIALNPENIPGDDAGPRIAGCFRSARAWWMERTPMRIDHTPPSPPAEGMPLVLRVAVVSDPLSVIVGGRAVYRTKGGAWKSTSFFPRTGSEIAIALSSDERAGVTEYYVIATNIGHSAMAQVGSAVAPLRVGGATDAAVAVAAGPVVGKKRPVTKKAWFWTVTAVLIAGVGAGAGVLVWFTQRPDSADIDFAVEVR